MPGPAAHRAMDVLRARAAAGELRPGEHWQYYLDALAEEDALVAELAEESARYTRAESD